MILLKNISKSYRSGAHTLRDINLGIDEGELVYIVGSTGYRKSTLVKLLDGEGFPDAGEVYVAETGVGEPCHSRVPFRRHNIGVVFQDLHLLSKMTASKNIASTLEVPALDKITIRRRVRETLGPVLPQDKAKSFPGQSFGGQQQRATIARATADHPRVLVTNEPIRNPDSEKSIEIIELLDKIDKVEGTTIVMVAYDSTLVNTCKKRTIVPEDGFIVADIVEGGYVHHDQSYTKSSQALHDGAP